MPALAIARLRPPPPPEAPAGRRAGGRHVGKMQKSARRRQCEPQGFPLFEIAAGAAAFAQGAEGRNRRLSARLMGEPKSCCSLAVAVLAEWPAVLPRTPNERWRFSGEPLTGQTPGSFPMTGSSGHGALGRAISTAPLPLRLECLDDLLRHVGLVVLGKNAGRPE